MPEFIITGTLDGQDLEALVEEAYTKYDEADRDSSLWFHYGGPILDRFFEDVYEMAKASGMTMRDVELVLLTTAFQRIEDGNDEAFIDCQ